MAHAYTIGPVDVSVSAYIGGVVPPTPPGLPAANFSLFGYTSPGAKVSVQNPGMYRDAIANDKGYFVFNRSFASGVVEDICLVAQDLLNRVTMPVCIPPPPPQDNVSLGPIIMPPTVSINNNSFFTGDRIVVSGQTAPSTDIKLSFFTDESKTSLRALLNPIHDVYAATLPKQDVKVDSLGNFTMTLPFEDSQYYRTFAQTIFEKAFSQKSITLNFDIFPGWFIIIRAILGFLAGLKGRLFEIILFGQILIIAYYVIHRFGQPHKIARMRALTLQEHPPLMTVAHSLLLQEHELVNLKLIK